MLLLKKCFYYGWKTISTETLFLYKYCFCYIEHSVRLFLFPRKFRFYRNIIAVRNIVSTEIMFQRNIVFTETCFARKSCFIGNIIFAKALFLRKHCFYIISTATFFRNIYFSEILFLTLFLRKHCFSHCFDRNIISIEALFLLEQCFY